MTFPVKESGGNSSPSLKAAQSYTPAASNRNNNQQQQQHQFHDVFTPVSLINFGASPYLPRYCFSSSPAHVRSILAATRDNIILPPAESLHASVPSSPLISAAVTTQTTASQKSNMRGITSPLMSSKPATSSTTPPPGVTEVRKVTDTKCEEEFRYNIEAPRSDGESLTTSKLVARNPIWPCHPGDMFQCPFEYYNRLLQHATQHGFTIARSFERYNSEEQKKVGVEVKKGYIYCNVLKGKNGRRGCCFSIRFVHKKGKFAYYRINRCNTGHLHPLVTAEESKLLTDANNNDDDTIDISKKRRRRKTSLTGQRRATRAFVVRDDQK